jgi:3''-deamino-3''-oxonicotianamine reductase
VPWPVGSSRNLRMEYVDLYLIHWPVCLRPAGGPPKFPNRKEDAVPLDVAGVWRAMEECQRLGLARAIGVSNFTTRHLDKVLAIAAVPPAVNQVELNPAWQQRTLRAYCADRGVHVAAYSPLGGQNWDGRGNAVLDSEVLAEIARARGKTVAQVSVTLAAGCVFWRAVAVSWTFAPAGEGLVDHAFVVYCLVCHTILFSFAFVFPYYQVALRWIHEQGVTCIVKSYNRERLKQNLEIFDWELTDDDRLKISHIPQRKVVEASGLFSQEGEFTSVDPAELNIVEE